VLLECFKLLTLELGYRKEGLDVSTQLLFLNNKSNNLLLPDAVSGLRRFQVILNNLSTESDYA